jgi:hypothetical protein
LPILALPNWWAKKIKLRRPMCQGPHSGVRRKSSRARSTASSPMFTGSLLYSFPSFTLSFLLFLPFLHAFPVVPSCIFKNHFSFSYGVIMWECLTGAYPKKLYFLLNLIFDVLLECHTTACSLSKSKIIQ